MNPYALVAIGLLLIFVEFYLPGMVLGIVGSCLIIVSVVLFGMQAGSPIELLFFVLGVGVAIALVIWFAITRIKSTAKKGTIYLESDQEGYFAASYDQTAIGKQGVALSDLKPSGFALIEGKRQQVASQSGYIAEGTPIVVIAGQGAVLLVKQVKKEIVS